MPNSSEDAMKRMIHDMDASIANDKSYPLNDFSKMKVGGKKMTREEQAELFNSVDTLMKSDTPNIRSAIAEKNDADLPEDLKAAAINKQRSIVNQLRKNSNRAALSPLGAPNPKAMDALYVKLGLGQRDAAESLESHVNPEFRVDSMGLPTTSPAQEARPDDGSYDQVVNEDITSASVLPDVSEASSDDSFDPVDL